MSTYVLRLLHEIIRTMYDSHKKGYFMQALQIIAQALHDRLKSLKKECNNWKKMYSVLQEKHVKLEVKNERSR